MNCHKISLMLATGLILLSGNGISSESLLRSCVHEVFDSAKQGAQGHINSIQNPLISALKPHMKCATGAAQGVIGLAGGRIGSKIGEAVGGETGGKIGEVVGAIGLRATAKLVGDPRVFGTNGSIGTHVKNELQDVAIATVAGATGQGIGYATGYALEKILPKSISKTIGNYSLHPELSEALNMFDVRFNVGQTKAAKDNSNAIGNLVNKTPISAKWLLVGIRNGLRDAHAQRQQQQNA